MSADRPLPSISPLLLRFFARVVKRYFRTHFRSVMVQNLHRLRGVHGSLIVYGNHSSWWDPLLMILLAQTALPQSRHYAPMDAEALARYPILRKLGIFPVEMNSARGAAMFLQTSTAILASGGVLWITPQGRFVDPQVRPLDFKPGITALARRLPFVPLMPMAIEYTFWDERLPETLVRFGEPAPAAGKSMGEAGELEVALDAEMNALRQSAIARDASAFEPMLLGRRGTGGLYAIASRMRALFTGKHLQQDHTPREE